MLANLRLSLLLPPLLFRGRFRAFLDPEENWSFGMEWGKQAANQQTSPSTVAGLTADVNVGCCPPYNRHNLCCPGALLLPVT